MNSSGQRPAPSTPSQRRPAATGPKPEVLSKPQRRLVRALKVVVCGYWAWVLWANFDPAPSAFDAIVVVSAPLLLSLHFVQGLMFLRLLRGNVPWWADFLQILVFGVLHLVPRSLELRQMARSRR
jgi:uncharacterized protein YhhL (DUF1145 family)